MSRGKCPECRSYRVVNGHMACLNEEGVCDHSFVISLEKAKKYSCSNFMDKAPRCMDCAAYESIREWCMHAKHVKNENNVLHPMPVREDKPACDDFLQRDDFIKRCDES